MNATALEDDTMVRAGRILASIERGDRVRLEEELEGCRGMADPDASEREELLGAVANRMRRRVQAGRPADEGPEAEAEIWLLRHLARRPADSYAKPI